MKLGYQDAGSWTLMKSDPDRSAKAAWLYAQFVTSKIVSLKKSHHGPDLHPRDRPSTTRASPTRAPKLGGLVEFYRSPARVQWTPTGTNVPDYPKLAQLWWQNVADAVTGEKTPQQAMDSLAKPRTPSWPGWSAPMFRVRAVRSSTRCRPPSTGSTSPVRPKPKLSDEKPKGETVAYEQLLSAWKQGKVR